MGIDNGSYGRDHGIAFIGNNGTLILDRGGWEVIEERQGMKIGCIEEVAYRMGYINADQLRSIAKPLVKSGYGQYLLNILS